MTDGELNLSTGLSLIVTEPSPLHIEWVKTLAKALDAHLDETRLCFSGPGIQIPQKKGPDNARDPDLVVCTAQQWSLVKRQTKALFLKGNAPLIAIEIVSPSSV
ncbi:MAG: Uma2 family endonuclease, partial [Cyanobacteria bacterium J06626_14]